jgi:hypothetical protein
MDVQLPDYILDFIITKETKSIDIIIKNNTKQLLNKNQEIQNILSRYKKHDYSICTYISGQSNIYDIVNQIVKNNLKNVS